MTFVCSVYRSLHFLYCRKCCHQKISILNIYRHGTSYINLTLTLMSTLPPVASACRIDTYEMSACAVDCRQTGQLRDERSRPWHDFMMSTGMHVRQKQWPHCSTLHWPHTYTHIYIEHTYTLQHTYIYGNYRPEILSNVLCHWAVSQQELQLWLRK